MATKTKVDVVLDLTDTEWCQLLDGKSDDSQLGMCCDSISALRDVFVRILRNGRKKPIFSLDVEDLKQKLGWCVDGHGFSDVVEKVCSQIGFDPKAVDIKHEPATYEM